MWMAPAVLPLLAAAAAAAGSDSAAPRQCTAPTTGRCPTPVPKSSYTASSGLLTAAECCAQCTADGSLCFGWTWTAPGPDGATAGAARPGGGTCNQFDAPLSTDQLQARNCTYGLNAADPAKPPPKASIKPPAGAKNVLFLVADGALPTAQPLLAAALRARRHCCCCYCCCRQERCHRAERCQCCCSCVCDWPV